MEYKLAKLLRDNSNNIKGNDINNNSLSKYNFNFDANDLKTQVVDYTKDTVKNTTNKIKKMNTLSKFALFIGIIILVFLLFLIFKFYLEQKRKENFTKAPLFLTNIEKNKPHDSEKSFKYINPETGKATQFIPGYNFKENNGLQYTFSFWMFIDGKKWDYRFGEWKHIFHRGTPPLMHLNDNNNIGNASDNNQIVKLTTQLPGFWISPKENILNCVFTTRSGEERITIDNVPINKWMNIVVTVSNISITLYKDGLLHKSINLYDNISTTKDNLYVNYFGGFGGNMAYLQFFDRVLTPEEIMALYKKYKINIDSYIDYMFGREIDKLNLSKIFKLKEEKCNYLNVVKQQSDKNNLIDRYLSINKILCDNTKGNTVAKCNDKNTMTKEFLANLPGLKLKEIINNTVNSLKPVNESEYEYIDEVHKNKVNVYLTDEEYKKIKSMI